MAIQRLFRLAGRLAMLALIVALTTAMTFVVVPRLMNWTFLAVDSPSMEPALPAGGFAIVEPVESAAIDVGDVVTFAVPDRPGALMSHRVTAIEDRPDGPALRTKGDANAEADTWLVPASAVLGRVRLALPWLGTVAEALRAQPDLLMLALVPAALIMLAGLGSVVWAGRRGTPPGEAATKP